jgi:hypothetical protein
VHRHVGRNLPEQFGDLGGVGDRRVDGDVRQIGDAEEVECQDVGLGDCVGEACLIASTAEALEPAAGVVGKPGVLVEVALERVDCSCLAVPEDVSVKQPMLRYVVIGEG